MATKSSGTNEPTQRSPKSGSTHVDMRRQRKQRSGRSLHAALFLSAATHVLLILSFPWHSPSWPDAGHEHSATIEVHLDSLPAPERETRPPEPESIAASVNAVPRRRFSRASDRTVESTDREGEPPTSPAGRATPAFPPIAAPKGIPAIPIDPRSAAAAATLPPPREPPGLRSLGASRPTVATREPALEELGDGRHVYQGPRFSATIRPNGEVVFEDRPNLGLEAPSARSPTVGVSFDVTDAIRRAQGVELHRSEKEAFLEATEELRARLRREAQVDDHRRAAFALNRRLGAIWSSDAAASHRRQRLFAIWNDCDAESEVGRRARAMVCDFIDRHLPPTDPLAYTDSELRELNRSRRSREPFAPYTRRQRSVSEPSK